MDGAGYLRRMEPSHSLRDILGRGVVITPERRRSPRRCQRRGGLGLCRGQGTGLPLVSAGERNVGIELISRTYDRARWLLPRRKIFDPRREIALELSGGEGADSSPVGAASARLRPSDPAE